MNPANHMSKHSLKQCTLLFVLGRRSVFEISEMSVHYYTEMWPCAGLARLGEDGLDGVKNTMSAQVASLGVVNSLAIPHARFRLPGRLRDPER